MFLFVSRRKNSKDFIEIGNGRVQCLVDLERNTIWFIRFLIDFH